MAYAALPNNGIPAADVLRRVVRGDERWRFRCDQPRRWRGRALCDDRGTTKGWDAAVRCWQRR